MGYRVVSLARLECPGEMPIARFYLVRPAACDLQQCFSCRRNSPRLTSSRAIRPPELALTLYPISLVIYSEGVPTNNPYFLGVQIGRLA